MFSFVSADKSGIVAERRGTPCWARLTGATTRQCYQRQQCEVKTRRLLLALWCIWFYNQERRESGVGLHSVYFYTFYVALCLHMKSSMMSESQSTGSCLYSSWFCDSVSTLLLGSTAEHWIEDPFFAATIQYCHLKVDLLFHFILPEHLNSAGVGQVMARSQEPDNHCFY